MGGAPVPLDYHSPKGGSDIHPTSDPLSIAQVKAVDLSIPRGYAGSLVTREGSKIVSFNAYPSGDDKLIIIAYSGSVHGESVILAREMVVVAHRLSGDAWNFTVALAGAGDTFTGVASAPEMSLSAGWEECVIALIAFAGAAAACAFVPEPATKAAACVAATGLAGVGAGVVCVSDGPTSATLLPKAQTVSGCGNCTGGNDEAYFDLTGSPTIPADRYVTNPFPGCSACPNRQWVYGGLGTSYHFYAPLGCTGRTETVTGVIYYPGGSRSDTATVALNNPNICSFL